MLYFHFKGSDLEDGTLVFHNVCYLRTYRSLGPVSRWGVIQERRQLLGAPKPGVPRGLHTAFLLPP